MNVENFFLQNSCKIKKLALPLLSQWRDKPHGVVLVKTIVRGYENL
jgi:hypothetical protein